ncbi:hypothetical protein BDN70DRAFT_882681 [Pholiota conissans]|uniref:Uncharacterized protein n=1 Tax=Pholiota conissans TaxID=109636 RepID=A0A9P6CRI3_9AGAR|nr:hypothetical protein BDN70DRAFT_882681 [Pholiota conissans]
MQTSLLLIPYVYLLADTSLHMMHMEIGHGADSTGNFRGRRAAQHARHLALHTTEALMSRKLESPKYRFMHQKVFIPTAVGTDKRPALVKPLSRNLWYVIRHVLRRLRAQM